MLDNHEISIIVETVKQAGQTLLEYWPDKRLTSAPQELEICQKIDGSFVTKADYLSNEIIMSMLNEKFPADAIFSEEVPKDFIDYDNQRVWILDPLDGTNSFIQGEDDFSILLALVHNRKPQFSIMFFPARGQCAIARKGQGAFLSESRLRTKSNQAPRSGAICVRHLNLQGRPEFYPSWIDSGLAFFKLCAGEIDGVIIRTVHHQEWDIAAPSLLITEAGGLVTDELGREINFNCAPVNFSYLVASNGACHDKLLQIVSEDRKVCSG